MTSHVRTVLGDIPASELGACGAHEHVIIRSDHVAALDPELRLDETEPAERELRLFHAAGGRAMIDTMPGVCGRDVQALAQVSRRSKVHLVCSTGLHLARYYPTDAPVLSYTVEQLADWFASEIEQKTLESPDKQPVSAGIIKVAGGEKLSELQRRAFTAAAIAQQRTGCPIITHTERGAAAMDQIELLRTYGARLDRVTLSHVDRNTDPEYHAAILDTGVCMEYDGAFRWKPAEGNPTVDLLCKLLPRYPMQLMVGMDAARRRYWQSYGGGPGMAWLMRQLPQILRAAGLDDQAIKRIYVDNPASAFSFFDTDSKETQ
ncbi:MAG: aryldialkylphosphatase [Phycisphaeraceae bacterium]|nr:aryldialkylphosphatase [Phycisphaeraceae bacterium]